MRDLFTVVAVLVVIVLGAALGAPYFIDWRDWRPEIESALQEALGTPVHTQGNIVVRLLPTPRLSLERVALGGSTPFLDSRSLHVTLDAAPLIGGKIKVNEARLSNPVIAVTIDDGNPFASLSIASGNAGAVSIDHLAVEGGTLLLQSPGGDELAVIGPIDLTAQATRLAGPWRVEGSYRGHGFHVATGEWQAEKPLRLKARTQLDYNLRGEFDGALLMNGFPSIEGQLKLDTPVGTTQQTQGDVKERLSITADVASEGWSIVAKQLDIKSGEGPNAPAFSGTGRYDSSLAQSNPSTLSLDLKAKRFSLDRQIDGDFSSSSFLSQSPLPALFSSLLSGAEVSMALALETVSYGDEQAGPVKLELHGNHESLNIKSLSAQLPGGNLLEAAGALSSPDTPAFSGHIRFKTGDAAWLTSTLKSANAPAAIVEAVQQWPDLRIESGVSVSRQLVAVHNLNMTARGKALSGAGRYTPATVNERARLDAQLVAEGLDLAEFANIDPSRSWLHDTDLGLTLEATNLTIGKTSAPDKSRMRLRLAATGEGIAIHHMELSAPGNGHLQASGTIDEEGGRILAKLTSDRPDSLLALVGGLLPDKSFRTIQAASTAWGPLALEATIARPGAGKPLVALVKGNAASSMLDARMLLDGAAASNERAQLDITLQATSSDTMLRQLGLPPQILNQAAEARAGRLVVQANGSSLSQLNGSLLLDTTDLAMTVKGQWQGMKASDLFNGKLELRATDAIIAHVAGVSSPGGANIQASNTQPLQLKSDIKISENHIDIKGINASFHAKPFSGSLLISQDNGQDVNLEAKLAFGSLSLADIPGWALAQDANEIAMPNTPVNGLRGTVSISADQLILGQHAGELISFSPVKFDLDMASNTTRVSNLEAGFGGGNIGGSVEIRRAGTQFGVNGRLSASHVSLNTLFGLRDHALPGTVNGYIEWGGAGETQAAILANLGGGGELQAEQTAIPHLDPAALTRLVGRFLKAESVQSDITRVREGLDSELDKASWPVPSTTVPLTISGGVIRFGPVMLKEGLLNEGVAQAQFGGTLDLATRTLDARAQLTSTLSPQDAAMQDTNRIIPQVGVNWKGPLQAPLRSIDAGSTANAIAAIGLTRELDRIDRLEENARKQEELLRRQVQ